MVDRRLVGDRPRFGDRLRAFLERFRLEEDGVDAEFFDGLRDRARGRPVDL